MAIPISEKPTRKNDPKEQWPLGVSRPPLGVDDLPLPEDVFNVPRIGFSQIVRLVLGPSLIALGAALGSGEWLLGPLAFGKYGFMGLGWFITVSAVLQTFYNLEAGRFTLATGEVPAVAFARTPPGRRLWIPLTLTFIFLGWIWGGWASAAGQSLFAVFKGGPPNMNLADPRNQVETVRLIGVALMVLSLGLFLFGSKISRTLEHFNAFAVYVILLFVIVMAVLVVPAPFWGRALASAVIPAAVPKGMDMTLLGAIVGYTGFGAGFNFMLINYYRDHGYGMGSKVGFISGMIGGGKREILPVGVTFRETERNAGLWKRWWRYLKIDQWGIFFTGAMIGMFVPAILVAYLAGQSGRMPTAADMPTFLAAQLGARYGQGLFIATLLVGAFSLFKTQATVLEMLIRNTADAAFAMFPSLRERIRGDMRRLYYPLAAAFIIVIGIIIHLQLPTDLVRTSANIANLASIVFPLVLIYLNTRLPRPARARGGSIIILLLNVVFFGFFFVNFLAVAFTGTPLVQF